MTAQIIKAHYVLAGSGEAAIALAVKLESLGLPPMAKSVPALLRLLRLHPGGYRPTLRAFRVYTGLPQPQFRLLDCIENVR